MAGHKNTYKNTYNKAINNNTDNFNNTSIKKNINQNTNNNSTNDIDTLQNYLFQAQISCLPQDKTDYLNKAFQIILANKQFIHVYPVLRDSIYNKVNDLMFEIQKDIKSCKNSHFLENIIALQTTVKKDIIHTDIQKNMLENIQTLLSNFNEYSQWIQRKQLYNTLSAIKMYLDEIKNISL